MNRLNFQLRVADKYKTIYILYRDGLEMYPSEKAIDRTALLIDTIAYVSHKFSLIDGLSSDRQ